MVRYKNLDALCVFLRLKNQYWAARTMRNVSRILLHLFFMQKRMKNGTILRIIVELYVYLSVEFYDYGWVCRFHTKTIFSLIEGI